MFPIYPGFEDLPIRVEVDWREQKRMVIARVECWPTLGAKNAVLICSFEGDAEAGEWIVTNDRGFYVVPSAKRKLDRPIIISSKIPYLSRSTRLNPGNEKHIRLLLQGTFNGGIARHGLARIFYLPELHSRLNIIVQMPHDKNLYWCPTQNLNDAVPFTLDGESNQLSSQDTDAYAQLRNAWQDILSDSRFAWEWSGMSKSEKFLELMGLHRRSEVRSRVESEMERIMRLILINYEMWGPDEQWTLYFELGGRSHIWHEDGRLEKNDQHLHEWNGLLLEYLMPQFRHDWIEKHLCIYDCWPMDAPSVSVEIEQPPTAHEQLEAKLQLRDWLADKATPDVAARLLAGLDD